MGLDDAGKTTLLYKFAISKITDIIPHHWSLDPNSQYSRSKSTLINYRGCARSYMYPLVRHFMMKEGGVSAVVWVVDATSSELSLDMSLEELGVLLQGDFAVERFLFWCELANKIDLSPSGANRKVPDDEFRAKFGQLLQGRRFAIFETSITAGYRPESGLAEAFAWLGDAITACASTCS
ncbi:hypothetical protein V8F33_013465 [Rhypophila sp. PSN 637]